MAKRPHTHPCALEAKGCTVEVPCGGTLERNHDGVPDVTCSTYHLPSGFTDPQACEECEADTCLACGRVVRFEGHGPKCSQHPEAR
jgi:hypothetical protein